MDRPTCFKRLAEADLRTQHGQCSRIGKRYVCYPSAVDLGRECACESVFGGRLLNTSFVPKECNSRYLNVPKECNSRYLKKQTDMSTDNYHRCCEFNDGNKSVEVPPTYTLKLNVLRNKKEEPKSKSFLCKMCTKSCTKSKQSCEPQRRISKCDQCDERQQKGSRINTLRLRDCKIDHPVTPRPNYEGSKSNQPHEVQVEAKDLSTQDDKPQITQYFCCRSLFSAQTSHGHNNPSTETHPVCCTRADFETIPRGNVTSDTNKEINIGVIKIIDKYIQNDNATCKPCEEDLKGKVQLRNNQQNTESRFLERGLVKNSTEEKKKGRKWTFWLNRPCKRKPHKEISLSSIHMASESEVFHKREMINATTQYVQCYSSQKGSCPPCIEPSVAITKEIDVPHKIHTEEVTTQYSTRNESHPPSMEPSIVINSEADIPQKIQTMNATTQYSSRDTIQKQPNHPSTHPSSSTHEAKNINPTMLYLSYSVQRVPSSTLTQSSPPTHRPQMVNVATQCTYPKESLLRLRQPCTLACIKHEVADKGHNVSVATQYDKFDFYRNEPSSPLIQPYISTPVKHPPNKVRKVNVATQCDNLPLSENKSLPPFIQPCVLTHDKLNIPHQKQTMNEATIYVDRDYCHKEMSLSRSTNRKSKNICPSRKRSKISPKRSRKTLCCKRKPKKNTNKAPQSSGIQHSFAVPIEPEITAQKANVTAHLSAGHHHQRDTRPLENDQQNKDYITPSRELSRPPPKKNSSCCKRNSRKKVAKEPAPSAKYSSMSTFNKPIKESRQMSVATQYSSRDHSQGDRGALNNRRKKEHRSSSRERSNDSPKRKKKMPCCKKKPKKKSNQDSAPSAVLTPITIFNEPTMKSQNLNMPIHYSSWDHPESERSSVHNYQRMKMDKEPPQFSVQPSSSKDLESQLPHKPNKVNASTQCATCDLSNNKSIPSFNYGQSRDTRIPSRERLKYSSKRKKKAICCKSRSKRHVGIQASFSIPIEPYESHRTTSVTTQDYKPRLMHYTEGKPTLLSRKIPCSTDELPCPCFVKPPQTSLQSTLLSPPTDLVTLPPALPLITQRPEPLLPPPPPTTAKMSASPESQPQPTQSSSTLPSTFQPPPSTYPPKFIIPSKTPEPVSKAATPPLSVTSASTFSSSASPLSFTLYHRKESHSDLRISSPDNHKTTTKTRTIEEIRMKIYKTKFREPDQGKSSNSK